MRLAAFVISLALAPLASLAQDAPPPHVPLQKTIGVGRPEVVPSLIVMNAGGARLDGDVLTLENVAKNAIVFADRPVRAAGHATTAALLDEWNENHPDSFHVDPPNATVSVFGETEDDVYDAVVVLKNPRMAEADLLFDVELLEGSIAGATGAAAVFIDIIGRPLTPLSYAGVARRTGRRAAWYGAAAADAAGPACGYPPYPPCY